MLPGERLTRIQLKHNTCTFRGLSNQNTDQIQYIRGGGGYLIRIQLKHNTFSGYLTKLQLKHNTPRGYLTRIQLNTIHPGEGGIYLEYNSNTIHPGVLSTGTPLREKLVVKNLKLLCNSKFLCHVITSFDKVGNDLRGDRFETIILYISDENRWKHKHTHQLL
jgi:hypothetical protein